MKIGKCFVLIMSVAFLPFLRAESRMMPSFIYANAPLEVALEELGSRLSVPVVIELKTPHRLTGDYGNLGILAAFLGATKDGGVSVFWDADKKLLWVSDSIPSSPNQAGITPLTLASVSPEVLDLISRVK
jgi:hypothetical protein